MSDFGCSLKKKMLYTLLDEERCQENISAMAKAIGNDRIIVPDSLFDRFEKYMCAPDVIRWINMPIYEGISIIRTLNYSQFLFSTETSTGSGQESRRN